MSTIIDVTPRRAGHELNKKPYTKEQTNEKFLATALEPMKSVQHLSRTTATMVGYPHEQFRPASASLLIHAAHSAFAHHVGLELTPEVVWYNIVEQMAHFIKDNATKYGRLFNGDPANRRTLKVRDDSLVYNQPSDWGRTISVFRELLLNEMGPDMPGLFLPKFTTSTDETDVALLVAFMDSMSKYFEYRVDTLCHIPTYRLGGTQDDWQRLYGHVQALGEYFPELGEHFGTLLPVLAKIVYAVSKGTVDETFWRSCYKFDGMSGGDFVNGWLTTLFIYKFKDGHRVFKTGRDYNWPNSDLFSGNACMLRTDSFGSGLASAPFIWNYYGDEKKMLFVSGVMGVEFDGTYVSPKLGYGVFEPEA